MSLVESALVFIISLILLILLMYVSYKISYKLGVKKALYRTTYILLSIIFAFLLTPFINRELFYLDLSKFNITLTYKGNDYITLIDYIEEVFAHSEFFNDLYAYFPSLKDLFMDFPQILLAPVTYVLLFFVFMIVWLPLYLYLSYKRKRRILYDREDKKSHRVFAGVLGAVQLVFIVSVVLSPINGINRIYQESISDTLDEEYDSLCEGNTVLASYKVYCDILTVYDSTVLAKIGGKKTLSNHIFDSLTRISYGDKYTTLSKEASMIIKSGIVLNQSGLFEFVSEEDSVITLPFLTASNLNEEDIDIIINTLSESKYSEDLLLELEDLTFNTLNSLLRIILKDESFKITNNLTKEEIINEIKIVLNILPILANTSFISDVTNLINIIYNYVNEFPHNRVSDANTFEFKYSIATSVDLDDLELVGEYLLQSKIVNEILPVLLDAAFAEAGFNFVGNNEYLLDSFYWCMDYARIIKKYHPLSVIEMVSIVSDEDLLYMAEGINYLCSSPDTIGFARYLVDEALKDVSYYNYEDFLNIRDWVKEALVIKEICQIAYSISKGESLDLSRALKVWNNKDSEAVVILKKLFKDNFDYFIKEILKSI